jgi:hypothetical protein
MDMFEKLRGNTRMQLAIGLGIGLIFGSLLYLGGVTQYNVIIGQLLLTDFTVIKVMLSAVVVGMIGIYTLRKYGLVDLHPKPGSIGSTVIGGLIFGMGFAILGYCPGTVAGAVGQGSLDALFGGVVGILIGAALFAALYPSLSESVFQKGEFKSQTIPELLNVNPWIIVIPMVLLIVGFLAGLEYLGL